MPPRDWLRADLLAVLTAKTVRTFCYGFLGIVIPVYLTELGASAEAVGAAVTLTLLGSAALTWAVRRPAERFGARVSLLALAGLSALAAGILVVTREPWLIVAAAMIGNVAVGAGETGPFLTVEQVVVARATSATRRTAVLSVYNFLGYGAGALGAILIRFVPAYRSLFLVFLAGSLLQALAYVWLPGVTLIARAPARAAAARPLIRRLAAVFAVDSFAGGFVLQSLVALFLHERFGLDLAALGGVFFGTQILTAASLFLAVPLARRFGLLPTMVVSHLVSNVLLLAVALAPTAAVAVALLFGRHLLSQIDVPTRQAWVMAVVGDGDREAAASVTNLARTLSQAVSPAVTGWVMATVALGAPFVLGGGLKIVYDVLLYVTFRDVPLRSETD
ncbi:MAG: MFS transporter [Candidatus Rokubacteria bacterium]|nr:MFS transporter [Candidatus Rokubacteria bacterium]